MTHPSHGVASGEHFHAAFESMVDCFGIYRAQRDEQGQIVDFVCEYVNEAACQSNQLTRAQQVGRGLCEVFPNHRDSGLFEAYCAVVATRQPLVKEMQLYTDSYGGQVLQRAFDIRVTALADGFAAIWRDVTERGQAEERLRLLADMGAALTASLDTDTTLQTAARLAIPVLADACAIHLFAPDGALRLVATASSDPRIEAATRRYLAVFAPAQLTMTPIKEILATRQPYLMSDPPLPSDDDIAREIGETFRFRSSIVLPLIANQRLLGILSFGLSIAGRQYREADLPFVEEVGRRIALALENARLYEEVQAARRAADESAALLNTLVMHAPVGFAAYDTALRYVLINDRLAAVNGLPVEAHAGKTIAELLPTLAPTVEPLLQRVVASGEPVLDAPFVAAPAAASGAAHHWLVNYYPIHQRDGALVGVGAVVVDITEQRQAERRAQLLDTVSRTLATSLDYTTTLAAVANLAVPLLADICLVHLIDEQGKLYDVGVACADPSQEALVREMLSRYPPEPAHSPVLADVFGSQTAVLLSDLPPDLPERAGRDQQHADLIRRIGPRAFLTAPIWMDGRPLGMLQLTLTEPERAYDQADVVLVEELARRCAQAIERARLYRTEQEARALAEQEAARTRRLLAVAETLSHPMAPEAAAKVILHESVAALDAFAGGLFLVSDDGEQFELIATVGYPPEIADQWRHFPVDTPLPIADAFRTGEPVWLTHLDQAADRYPDFVAAVRAFTGAVAVIPLVVSGAVIGGLGLSFAQPQTLRPIERAFAQALAQQCAQVLARAQADARLHALTATLERRVEERTSQLARANRELADEVAERQRNTAALRVANEQLSELTAQLARSRNLLQTLFDGLPDGMVLLDHSGTVRAANLPLAELLQLPLDQLLQRSWGLICSSLNPPCPAAWVLDALRESRAEQRRVRYTPAQRRTRVLDIQTLPLPASGGHPPQLIVHFIDSTQRLQLETIAIQSERYIASSTLAAMVAHEVNTPLQAVKNFLFLIADAGAHERAHFVALAREELRRMGDIVGQLLDLYRPMTGELAPVDLNALIERVRLLTNVTCQRQGVRVVTELAPDLPVTRGRADQLVQLILNLVVNALEAMPEGGTLTITSHVEPRPARKRRNPAPRPQPAAIILTVSDTGAGIAPGSTTSIFEPFFTTKPEGSGLGLAICATIAAQHGGSVTTLTPTNQGATFVITLPVEPPSAPKG